jgi:hypothetical protein
MGNGPGLVEPVEQFFSFFMSYVLGREDSGLSWVFYVQIAFCAILAF